MSTNVMPESPHQQEPQPGWQSPREAMPSQVRAEEPTLARWIGFGGLWLLTLGIVLRILEAKGRSTGLTEFLWPIFTVMGLGGILFHALRDADLQVRRTYGIIGYAWIVLGIAMAVLPLRGSAGAMFLPYGAGAFSLGLLFLMPYMRNEADDNWRRFGLYTLAVVGIVMALAGFIGGNISENFLLPYTLFLTLLGLFYLWAFVGLQGVESDLGFRMAQVIGIMGALALLAAFGRSLPELFYQWRWVKSHPAAFFVPSGLLLAGFGLLYLAVAIGFVSDNRLIVLTRRELASIFFSPIAYIVLFGSGCIGWVILFQFARFTLPSPETAFQRGEIPEPILLPYFLNFWTVIAVVLIVPVLTMRTFSEEKRSGTLEVLMTAPVSEALVVVGKFLATWIFYFLAILPWGLYLVSLRVEGGQPFEYRPLLTFFIALLASGAGLISMGIFFSSLTRNQIAAALLTAAGVIGWTVTFFINRSPSGGGEAPWDVLVNHISFISLWWTSIEGRLAPALLVFHVSLTIFWLFLTTKVLEARKWA